MKYLVASPLLAVLAAVNVSAIPLRMMVVSSQQEVTTFRSSDGNSNVAIAVTSTQFEAGPQKHKSCAGSYLRDKALEMSNAFRQALGMPLIEKDTPVAAPDETIHHHVIPSPFIGLPAGHDNNMSETAPINHHGRYHFRNRSFLRRVHRALSVLGPWEGRAVAFVLGCGIGVLLRMIWVMAIVTYRIVRGGINEEEVEYTYTEFVFDHDAEDVVLAPPQYSDEKVEVADVKPIQA